MGTRDKVRAHMTRPKSRSTTATLAQDEAFQNPCEQSPITDFNFWVGEWVAFDVNTGIVQGIDRIERINTGCTIFQEWNQLTDRFRTFGAPYRYAGVSFSSVISGGKWQQVWIGNGGGTIHSWGEVHEKQEDGTWSETIFVPWDLTYVPRADVGNLIVKPASDE